MSALNPLPPSDPQSPLRLVRSRWRWFVALGVLLVGTGMLASWHVLTAALVSVIFVATLMLIAGAGMLINAWRMQGWAGFLVWTLSGVLYLGAGILAFARPMLGAALLTLLLGATLIGSGGFRLWVWFQNRAQPGWRWLAFSGAITLLAGLLIALGWPGNSVFILGFLLALDLVFQGVTLIMLGLALRTP